MKEVLISIQPKWCELIASGKKTVEIRKTAPKIEGPFKCYIYCTHPKVWFRYSSFGRASDESLWLVNGKVEMCDGFKYWHDGGDYTNLNGKVIGEFVCDRTTPLFNVCYDSWPFLLGDVHKWHKQLVKMACLTEDEIKAYANGKNCYAWQFSGLKIYDKPKPLSDFYKECAGLDNTGLCYECENAVGEECDCAVNGHLHFTRPPQSWCYVEAL